MPSREIRRLKAKKQETVSAAIEKRKESHPFLYAFSVIVLVVIVVTFVAVGPGGPLRNVGGAVGSIVFGSYDKKDIVYQSGNYFAQERDRIEEQTRQSGQNQQTESEVYSIWYQAYQDTIIHMAVLNLVEKAGLQISDDGIDKSLLTYPSYLVNGKFSEEAYNKIPLANRVQTRRNTREQLMQDQFLQDAFSGMKTTDQEKQFILSMAKDERSFQFVSLLFSSYPAEEIKKYAEANTAEFRKIKVSRILIKSGENEAREIRKKIVNKPTSFEDLAKTYSKDTYATNGGDMGWRFAYDLQADFDKKEQAQSIFSLKAGELSDVLKGTYGWLMYRCDTPVTDPDLSDSATLDTVKNYILKYERGKVEDYFTERAGKLARRSGEIGFSAAAKELGAQVNKTEYFSINLNGVFTVSPVKAIPDSATPASAVYNEDFFVKAFSLGKDQASSPIVLDDQILVLKLEGERTMPETDLKTMERFPDYLASQSLQMDLQSALVNPSLLKDNFDATFSTYVYRSQQAQ
jgi:parvulin-like peptidyl-prolyl isomerase